MDGIKIDVTGNIAKVTEKPRRITSGTIGLPVEFTFDDQWDGLSKKAVFRTGHFSIVCDLNEEEDTVPWEVLVFPNMWLSIGVYGVNEGGTISIPTIWVNVSVIQPGTVPDGASPAEPTPPVWQRIEDEVNRIGGVVDDVNNQYDGTQDDVEKLTDRVSDLEKNGTVMIVYKNVDDDTLATETYATIFNHVQKGGSVYFDDSGRIALSELVPYKQEAIFERANPRSKTIFRYTIDSIGMIVYEHESFATADQIGDISSALDELHAYAQGLIDGGASV